MRQYISYRVFMNLPVFLFIAGIVLILNTPVYCFSIDYELDQKIGQKFMLKINNIENALRLNNLSGNPESILNEYLQGKSQTRIIIRYRNSHSVQNNLSVNDLNIRSRKVLNGFNKVVMDLTKSEFREMKGFKYINGFTVYATLDGLFELTKHPEILSIEKDMVSKPHLKSGISLINGDKIRAQYNGRGISVAVVDTGIDYTHEMLGNGAFPNSKVIGGYDFGKDDADPMDELGHGTACAGIIAGNVGDREEYVGGIAYNAKLYAVKVSHGQFGETYFSDIVRGWEWCVDHQFDDPENPIMIINTSLGGGREYNICDDYMPLMAEASKLVLSAGITIFASSGNNGYCDSMSWPACISDVISVGAVFDSDFGIYKRCVSPDSCASLYRIEACTGWEILDYTEPDGITSYSNIVSFMDLLAPSNPVDTLRPNNSYIHNFGGTSAASAYAAGAAASIQAAVYKNTDKFLAPDQLKQIMIDGGKSIKDPETSITKSRIDLYESIKLAMSDNFQEPASGNSDANGSSKGSGGCFIEISGM